MQIELPATYVYPDPLPVDLSGYQYLFKERLGRGLPIGYFERMTKDVQADLLRIKQHTDAGYIPLLGNAAQDALDALIELGIPVGHSSSSVSVLEGYLALIKSELVSKQRQYQLELKAAQEYSGTDARTLSAKEIKAASRQRAPGNWRLWRAFPESEQKAFQAAYTAGYRAAVLAEAIRVLTARTSALEVSLGQASIREAAARRFALMRAAQAVLYRDPRVYLLVTGASAIAAAGQGIIKGVPGTASWINGISEAVAALKQAVVEGPAVYIADFLALALNLGATPGPSQDHHPARLRYSVGIGADQLGLASGIDLQRVAATQGSVEMPSRLVEQLKGDRSVISVISTDGERVPRQVPVRAAVMNATTGLYEVVVASTQADQPAITLTWTPSAAPGSQNASSSTPAFPLGVPVYTGVTLEPIIVKATTYPAGKVDIRDLIVWFPVDAGISPVYVMLSSPYDGATTRGEHSGRMYNPDKSGGPIKELDWRGTSVTQEGIDLVKLHTSRFGSSDANAIMISRLERVLRGETAVTDVDRRFYTHEIRELERYRALGVPDGVLVDDEGATWNNTHAATLEDYQLRDSSDLFYTPEAIEAGDLQAQRENK